MVRRVRILFNVLTISSIMYFTRHYILVPPSDLSLFNVWKMSFGKIKVRLPQSIINGSSSFSRRKCLETLLTAFYGSCNHVQNCQIAHLSLLIVYRFVVYRCIYTCVGYPTKLWIVYIIFENINLRCKDGHVEENS